MKLSSNDESRLRRVHPDLARIIRRAAEITSVPFTVLQSDRTLAQQRENVRKGVSKTMKSRHLISPDGFVRAVDIAPLEGKSASFAWPLYFKLAPIIKQAAKDVGMDKKVNWGGVWDRTIDQLSNDTEKESAAYVMRQKKKGKSAFLDGPHWQLTWEAYP